MYYIIHIIYKYCTVLYYTINVHIPDIFPACISSNHVEQRRVEVPNSNKVERELA
jgi:hypothetical protein